MFAAATDEEGGLVGDGVEVWVIAWVLGGVLAAALQAEGVGGFEGGFAEAGGADVGALLGDLSLRLEQRAKRAPEGASFVHRCCEMYVGLAMICTIWVVEASMSMSMS